MLTHEDVTMETDRLRTANKADNSIVAHNTATLFAQFETSVEELEELTTRSFLLDGIIQEKSHVVFYGASGTAKTTLTFYMCEEMLATNPDLQIVYYLLDGSEVIALNAKKWINDSRLTTSVKHKAQEIIDNFSEKIENKTSLNNMLFVFDTYKKFQENVNSKGSNTKHMNFIREITKLGATCISIAHTNKDGVDISGTAELEQDSDAVYRFDAVKDLSGDEEVIVSIKADGRIRWKPTSKSYILPKHDPVPELAREVPFLDVELWRSEKDDKDIINIVRAVLKQKKETTQRSLRDKVCIETGESKQNVTKLLHMYKKRHWNVDIDRFKGGAYNYSLIEY